MKIPRGMTEKQVLEVIEEIVTKLSPKLVFGYNTIEDIQQEGRIKAMTVGLNLFKEDNFTDAEMPKALERFLRVCVVSRMKNFRRDNIGRSEHPVNPDKLEAWEKRGSIRRNIMCPISIHEIAHHNLLLQTSVIDEIHNSHLTDLINRELPIELRNDFLRMCDGVRLPKPRQTKVREAIAEIIKEDLIDEEDI